MNLTNLENLNKKITMSNEKTIGRIAEVEINKLIKNPINFYDEYYDLDNLVASIKEFGLIEPIQITANYLVISGHRRLEACKRAKLNQIKVIFVESEDKEKLAIKLIEANRHREKTSEERQKEIAILEKYYQNLQAKGLKPKGRIRTLIAKDLGISEATVSRNLKKVSNDTNNKDNGLKNFRKLDKILRLCKKDLTEEKVISTQSLEVIIDTLFENLDLKLLEQLNEEQNNHKQFTIDDCITE